MDEAATKKYAFVLGRERELCLAELKAVLARFNPELSRTGFDFCFSDLIVSDNVAFINLTAETEDVKRLSRILGGTTKIFRVISSLPRDLSSQKISPPVSPSRNDNTYKGIIENYIRTHRKKEGKFNYGISSYSRAFNQRSVNNLGLSIKKELKKELSLRFIEIREGQEVSSILSYKNKLATEGFEFGIFESGETGILIAGTNPEEWSERDYDKPAGDKYSGMLPPKLARIMVNLALGASRKQKVESEKQKELEIGNCPPAGGLEIPQHEVLVVDPFCGSGNILLEALMLGCDVFGSDNSARAVKDTEANVEWLKAECGRQNVESRIMMKDATSSDLVNDLSALYALHSTYDGIAVVTEPYLGEPKKFTPSMNAVRGEYGKIKELYLSFLTNLKNLSRLNKNIVFCLVFPLVETTDGKQFSLYGDSVDEIRKIGYTELRSPLKYGRDYQVVKREIVLLSLNS